MLSITLALYQAQCQKQRYQHSLIPSAKNEFSTLSGRVTKNSVISTQPGGVPKTALFTLFYNARVYTKNLICYYQNLKP